MNRRNANVDESSEANGGEASQGLKISGKEKPKSAMSFEAQRNLRQISAERLALLQ